MTLYLLPNLLHEESSPKTIFPAQVAEIIPTLTGLIAESDRGGRRYLRHFSIHLPIMTLNEHTHPRDLLALTDPLVKGEKWGLISDAGLPCLADPGSQLVQLCHQKGIRVEAVPGPSSLMLILMLSGLPSQRFTFHGYLQRDKAPLMQQLRQMEKEPGSHVFIEAPYRNQKLLEVLLEGLSATTLLCVAWNLTTPSEQVITDTIAHWKKRPLPPINDKPAIFQLHHRA